MRQRCSVCRPSPDSWPVCREPPLLFSLIDTLWLKAGPISNRLFDSPEAFQVLNEAHEDLVKALSKADPAAVRRALERDIFTAGQFLRRRL